MTHLPIDPKVWAQFAAAALMPLVNKDANSEETLLPISPRNTAGDAALYADALGREYTERFPHTQPRPLRHAQNGSPEYPLSCSEISDPEVS